MNFDKNLKLFCKGYERETVDNEGLNGFLNVLYYIFIVFFVRIY